MLAEHLPAELGADDKHRFDAHAQGPNRLARLHESDAGSTELGLLCEAHRWSRDGLKYGREIDEATRYGCGVFNRVWKESALRGEFVALYERFIEEVIAPMLGSPRLVYQAVPVFRVFLPRHLGVGPRHTDAAYHSQPNEINFWVPLTPAHGTNSLFVESQPGEADFEPITAGVGTMYRFRGNACEHYSEMNVTDGTRVSFDFRVIREQELPLHPVRSSTNGAASGSRGAAEYFSIGRYYQQLQPEHDDAQAQPVPTRGRRGVQVGADASPERPPLSLDNYLAQGVFHHIDVAFPGVELVHEEPYIFLVHDFVSASECVLLRSMIDAERKQPSATAPAQQQLRTSTCVFPDEERVAWLRERIAAVTRVRSLRQLEPTKLTSYQRGQFFLKHTDASFLNEKLFAYSARLAGVDDDGVQLPCAWPSRHCTLFLYLNDVARGGRTCFRWLDADDSLPGAPIFSQAIASASGSSRGLEHGAEVGANPNASATAAPVSSRPGAQLNIVPRAGMAVIHFPTTTLASGCVPDPRTMHESEAALDPKYIVQQFIWPLPIDPGSEDTHEDVRQEWITIRNYAERQ